MYNLINILFACIATVLIELSLSTIFIRNIKEFKYVAIINVLTNIPLNVMYLIINCFTNSIIINYSYIFVGELIVFLVEGYYYKKHLNVKINSYLLSLLLNVISFTFGLIISL